MRKLSAALVAACLAGGALFAIPALAATKTVTVKDDVFSPKSTSVSKGTTVKFVWRGRHPHNVVVKRGPVKFKSPLRTSGSYSKRLTRAGSYSIICQIHPGMQMTLRVR